MFKLKLNVVSSLLSIGLLMFSATAVQAATCNGRNVTMNITNLNQLTFTGTNGWGTSYYELVGTRGDDTVNIDLQGTSGWNTLTVKLRGAGVVGGIDYVCANSDVNNLVVEGGKYLKVRGEISGVLAQYLHSDAHVDVEGRTTKIYTGAGNNTVIVNHGDVWVYGGTGSDDVTITDSYHTWVDTKGGNDTINIWSPRLWEDRPGLGRGGPQSIVVDAGSGDDFVRIDDAVFNSDHGSFVVGGEGEDTIVTGDGNDLVYGSAVSYNPDNSLDLISAAHDLFTADYPTLEISRVRSNFTPLYSEDQNSGEISTGDGDDYIYGTDGMDEIDGQGGNDTIKAYGARDRVWGGHGNDYLDGNLGDDDIYGETGNDTMDGGGGNDWMRGNDGNDIMKGSGGNDGVMGGDGNDTIDGGSGTDECRGDAGSDSLVNCN